MKRWINGLVFGGLLAFTVAAYADELLVTYIDDNGQEQTLSIDANSPDVDVEMAANLILQGAKIEVTLDGKEDLGAIADAVSNKAPDNATAIAIRNTILGVGAALGHGGNRTNLKLEGRELPVSTPPVLPSALESLPSEGGGGGGNGSGTSAVVPPPVSPN